MDFIPFQQRKEPQNLLFFQTADQQKDPSEASKIQQHKQHQRQSLVLVGQKRAKKRSEQQPAAG